MGGQLAEATCSSATPYGQDVVAEDGIAFLVARGAPPSIAALEQSWYEAVELDQDVVVKDGIAFLLHVEHLCQQRRLSIAGAKRRIGIFHFSEAPH